MPLPVLWLLQLLQRWFGWEWAVLVVRRDDDLRTLKLPDNLPVSVRENTDGSVGLTVGHDDHGEALLADLRALMGRDDVSNLILVGESHTEPSPPGALRR